METAAQTTDPGEQYLARLVDLLRRDPDNTMAAAFLLTLCEQGQLEMETARCLWVEAVRVVYFEGGH